MAKLKKKYENQHEKISNLINEGLGTEPDPISLTSSSIILENIIQFNPELPQEYRIGYINKARIASKQSTNIVDDFLLKLTNQETEYLSKKITGYYLLTQISIPNNYNIKIKRINNCVININPSPSSLPGKMIPEREKILDKAKKNITGTLPSAGYSYVKVTVKARCPYDAYHKSMDSLNFFRGIWNLSDKFGENKLHMSIPKTPLNRIVLGPIHTIHDSDFNLPPDDVYWYEPVSIPQQNTSIDINKMVKEEKFIRDNIAKGKRKKEIMDIFIKYALSMDSTIWEDSYLKLSVLLEKLTGSDQTKKIIKRASFLYRREDYILLKLEYLRDYRNSLSHTNYIKNTQLKIDNIIMLRKIIERLINYHIRIGNRFKTMGEACDFLDLATDKKELSNVIANINLAKKIFRF